MNPYCTKTTTIKDKFEYLVLTNVHGPLTYTSLKIIKDELKANTASIHSNFGGGTHGHLELVLTQPEYSLISAIPYLRPVPPALLAIAPGTTQHDSNRLCNNHKEYLRLFCEAVDLEKALLKLLSHVFPAIYLNSFCSRLSNAINERIPTIFPTLFQTYSQIPKEELQQEENNLRAKVFDIVKPLIIMFNEVEYL